MDGQNMGPPFHQIMAFHDGPLQAASSNLESGLNLKLFEGIKVTGSLNFHSEVNTSETGCHLTIISSGIIYLL